MVRLVDYKSSNPGRDEPIGKVISLKRRNRFDRWLEAVPSDDIVLYNRSNEQTYNEFHRYYKDDDIDMKNTDTYLLELSRSIREFDTADDTESEIIKDTLEEYTGIMDDGWELVSKQNIPENDKKTRYVMLKPGSNQYYTNALFKMIIDYQRIKGYIDPVITPDHKLDFYRFCYKNTV